jgi:hypothetical protein
MSWVNLMTIHPKNQWLFTPSDKNLRLFAKYVSAISKIYFQRPPDGNSTARAFLHFNFRPIAQAFEWFRNSSTRMYKISLKQRSN